MAGLAVPYDTPVKGILNPNLDLIRGQILSHARGLGVDEILSPHLQPFLIAMLQCELLSDGPRPDQKAYATPGVFHGSDRRPGASATRTRSTT